MSGLTTIARGDTSRAIMPRRVLARTEEEWRALWAVHAGPGIEAPAIDLTRVVVAAAFAGEKPSAGHSIAIAIADRSADQPDDAIRLVTEERGPGDDMVGAAIITSPFHIVAVPKGAEIAWSDMRDASSAAEAADTDQPDFRASRLAPPASTSTGLEPNTASALAYLAGPFSGALILFSESANQDVRFHAWQSIVGLGGLGLAVIASYILAMAAIFVSAAAVSLMVGVATVIWIVLAIVWVICLWKAWSGERWKLPLAGDYAERLTAPLSTPRS